MPRPRFTWNLGQRHVPLGERTLVMGVLNVTPDSFSDGGQFLSPTTAIDHGLRLLDEGADILDIGGESTRPGASTQASSVPQPPREAKGWGSSGADSSVSATEELSRILPVLTALRSARPHSILSVDTYKAEVARRAVQSGADIVNDVSGLRWDSAMASTLAALNCGAILMHTRGRPDEWRSLPAPDDIVALVLRELRESVDLALAAGIARDRIVLDPGFGFGKRFDENYPILSHFDRLQSLGFPLLSGPSRKGFLGRTAGTRLGVPDLPPSARLSATLAAGTASVLKGAHIVRVHDVRPTVEAVSIADAILNAP